MTTLTAQQAKQKIERYCAYQERSHQEVRNKLYSFGLYRDDVEEMLSGLVTDGYLNEERFAKAFAGGKFRMKKWGRNKIAHALEGKGVSQNCIRIGLEVIDDQEYLVTLRALLKNKASELEEDNIYVSRDHLSRFAIRKGYEPDLVWREVDVLLPR